MIEVSNLFRDKIYDKIRTTTGKVSFELVDVKAYEDASVIPSDESEISRVDQTFNKVRDMNHKYATFEPDYFLLDGSFYIPPKATEGKSEVGWWSDIFSSSDNTFITPPTLEFNFTEPHSSMGLSVVFDKQANEYATDFLIEVFDGADTLILSKSVTANDSASYVLEENINDYQRIKITVQKWANPNRRARITEVDFGIVWEYSGEELISFQAIEEIDLLASTVPSNEMKFVLDNSENKFNILNPDGIYQFIKPDQQMTAQIGLLLDEGAVEYIPMGISYLNDWIIEEGGSVATFIGRDIFSKLDAVDYTNLLQNTNLYDLAVDVLGEANVTNYTIDEALKDITTNGFTEIIKAREALQMIAMAGRSVINQDRYGSVTIKQIEELAFETGYLIFAGQDHYAGMTTPKVYQNYQHQAIDFETSYEVPQIKLATAVTHLVFKIYTDTGVSDYKIVNAEVVKGQGYEIDNPLINSESHAIDVADWMFREYGYIAEYKANWRQNPALECGDIILIQDSYGRKKKARITKQEFEFAGYLNGLTEAKGGV